MLSDIYCQRDVVASVSRSDMLCDMLVVVGGLLRSLRARVASVLHTKQGLVSHNCDC